jgi:O-antigen/teichoic acid export membrane protein
MAYLPVVAVLQVMLPRYFSTGEEGGLPATASFARRLAKPLLAYGVVATGIVIAVAPLVPLVVGEAYRESVPLLMLLAPLVLAKVAQTTTGDALTGAGLQRTRTLCAGIAAGTNVAINLTLIPLIGLTGALVATFAAELLLVVLLLVAVRTGLRASTVGGDPGAPDVDQRPGSPTSPRH